MAKNNAILEKGAYVHHQNGAFVEVKNFILSTRQGKRCLLLQFSNSSEHEVSAIRFNLVQMDASGNVIAENECQYSVKIAAASDYSLPSGLVIKDECVDFRVHMLYVVSGAYKYSFKNGEAIQSYDPRGYSDNKSHSKKGNLEVKRIKPNSERLHTVLAAMSVLAVLMACAFVLLLSL